MLIIQAKRKITELLKFPLGGGGGGVAKAPCFNHSYVRNNNLNTQYLFYFLYEQFIGMTPHTTNLEFGLSNSQAFSNIN